MHMETVLYVLILTDAVAEVVKIVQTKLTIIKVGVPTMIARSSFITMFAAILGSIVRK